MKITRCDLCQTKAEWYPKTPDSILNFDLIKQLLSVEDLCLDCYTLSRDKVCKVVFEIKNPGEDIE